jgi:hypothetical protein
MKHKDFRIGGYFYMSAHKYLCTDIGTRTICAVRADYAEVTSSCNGKRSTRTQKLTREVIGGPPYWLEEMVIDEYDMVVCFKTKKAAEFGYGEPCAKVNMPPKSSKLTKQESELMDSVERGEWKSVPNLAAEKRKAMLAARGTLKKINAKRLKDLLARMPHSYFPHEEDWGSPAGKEVW